MNFGRPNPILRNRSSDKVELIRFTQDFARMHSRISLTDEEFERFRQYLHQRTGISLGLNRRTLVASRLFKRLLVLNFSTYTAYIDFVLSTEGRDELQIMLDLLTTHETQFFREMKHFDFLKTLIKPGSNSHGKFRVWSAACSTGEEPYSIAMVLDDMLGPLGWEVVGSDISHNVLQIARDGCYANRLVEKIPPHYRHKYCRSACAETDTVTMPPSLKKHITFRHINLNSDLPALEMFDVIFLRNVMIYFDNTTKRSLVARLFNIIRSGGHLFIGHSETLNEVSKQYQVLQPAIYQRM